MINITKKALTGMGGESIVCNALYSKGYNILGRNIRYKCGELDIVAKKNDIIHFIEVKTINVSYETGNDREYGLIPEDNVTSYKIKKTLKAIEVYLMSFSSQEEVNWQFDIAAVYLYPNSRYKIKFYPNIVL